MHPTIYLVASLAALSKAFTLPENVADGVYVASYNEAGEEVHVPYSDASPIVPSPDRVPSRPIRRSGTHSLHRRADIWCGCGHQMNRGDCDSAVAQFKDKMNAEGGGYIGIGPNSSAYVKVGSVVTFICNYTPDTSTAMTAFDFGGRLGEITSTCGLYTAGTLEHVNNIDVGYMVSTPGLDFCRNARNSGDHSC